MEPLYTAQRIEGTTNGWLVTEVATEKRQIVFCNDAANTAEDAVAIIQDQVQGDV